MPISINETSSISGETPVLTQQSFRNIRKPQLFIYFFNLSSYVFPYISFVLSCLICLFLSSFKNIFDLSAKPFELSCAYNVVHKYYCLTAYLVLLILTHQ